MNLLVNIVVFGTVGAVMVAALLGLVLLRAGRTPHTGVSTVFAVVAVAVFLTVPTLAASTEVAGGTGAGFGQAYLVAFGVVAITYLANSALLPFAARRVATRHGAHLTPSVPALAGGLFLCAAFSLLNAGLATLVS